ncbi:putative actin-related protein 6 [Apostichopus japonicus]|uniref:Putative actin-related protein 6 n=1 Tax=Stichopus japonicus TaxID=307972 RepID=A0A2G8LHM7_STIJA|nr:putative actin-related protein 6 [Apostichopus japonicus]
MDSTSKVVILDNGAYSAKIGYSTDSEPRSIQNCIAKAKSERRKQFIGNQYEDCRDLSGLYYLLPFQKIMGENEKDKKGVGGHAHINSTNESMNEVFFEEYKFKALHRTNAGTLSAYLQMTDKPQEQCCLVVESGYSFTHIVHITKGKKYHRQFEEISPEIIEEIVESLSEQNVALRSLGFAELSDCQRLSIAYMRTFFALELDSAMYSLNNSESAVKIYLVFTKTTEPPIKINVGGKLLTNHLKEILSYRQLHVMDETYVINQVKEDACFVSSTIYERYGNIQVIRLNNERFAVPEVLFNPSDVSIQEMGIPEAIVYCIGLVQEDMRPHLFKNIILTGGNSLFPGFKERVERDVRAMAPLDYEVKVTLPENAITHSWQGGKKLSQKDDFSSMCVTKKEFEEHGQSICQERFDV